MDGHFVPNIALGPPIVQTLRPQLPNTYLDCHLMVSEPLKWIPEFAKAGASSITFHIEAVQDPFEAVALTKQHNVRVGVCLKPKTPAESVFAICDAGNIDLILVMTVEPGFGGQKFMEDMMPKVAALRARYPNMNIQVDGGLDPKTVEPAAKAGANVIVAGTSVFKAESRKEAITKMRDTVAAALASATANAAE